MMVGKKLNPTLKRRLQFSPVLKHFAIAVAFRDIAHIEDLPLFFFFSILFSFFHN